MVTVAALPVEVVVLTHVTAVVIFLVMVQWNEFMGDVVSGVRCRCKYLVVPVGGVSVRLSVAFCPRGSVMKN